MDEPKKPRRRKKVQPLMHCSFCEKSQEEVRKLIAKGTNPADTSVLICDECIELCNEIIAEESLAIAKQEPAELVSYILRQQETIKTLQERISEAAHVLAASLAPGGDTRH